jgi:hypothetical protein
MRVFLERKKKIGWVTRSKLINTKAKVSVQKGPDRPHDGCKPRDKKRNKKDMNEVIRLAYLHVALGVRNR